MHKGKHWSGGFAWLFASSCSKGRVGRSRDHGQQCLLGKDFQPNGGQEGQLPTEQFGKGNKRPACHRVTPSGGFSRGGNGRREKKRMWFSGRCGQWEK